MRKLSSALKANSSTCVNVYHKYKHNLDEIKLMEEFTKSLGFGLEPTGLILCQLRELKIY